jgi:1,4-alpha-glucan branching enzyme
MPDLTVDPIYAPKDAAKYLGVSPRTLLRLTVRRHPMPGTGHRYGYRLSAMNEYLARIADPKSRAPKHTMGDASTDTAPRRRARDANRETA